MEIRSTPACHLGTWVLVLGYFVLVSGISSLSFVTYPEEVLAFNRWRDLLQFETLAFSSGGFRVLGIGGSAVLLLVLAQFHRGEASASDPFPSGFLPIFIFLTSVAFLRESLTGSPIFWEMTCVSMSVLVGFWISGVIFRGNVSASQKLLLFFSLAVGGGIGGVRALFLGFLPLVLIAFLDSSRRLLSVLMSWRIAFLVLPLVFFWGGPGWIERSGLSAFSVPRASNVSSWIRFAREFFLWSFPWGWALLSLVLVRFGHGKFPVRSGSAQLEPMSLIWLAVTFLVLLFFSSSPREAYLYCLPAGALYFSSRVAFLLGVLSDQDRTLVGEAIDGFCLSLVLLTLMTVLSLSVVSQIPVAPTLSLSRLASVLRAPELRSLSVIYVVLSCIGFRLVLSHRREYVTLVCFASIILLFVGFLQCVDSRLPGLPQLREALLARVGAEEPIYVWAERKSPLLEVVSKNFSSGKKLEVFPQFPPRCGVSVLLPQQDARLLLSHLRIKRLEEVDIVLYQPYQPLFPPWLVGSLALISLPSCRAPSDYNDSLFGTDSALQVSSPAPLERTALSINGV